MTISVDELDAFEALDLIVDLGERYLRRGNETGDSTLDLEENSLSSALAITDPESGQQSYECLGLERVIRHLKLRVILTARSTTISKVHEETMELSEAHAFLSRLSERVHNTEHRITLKSAEASNSTFAQQEAVETIKTETKNITSLTTSPDGKYVVSCGDNRILLWDTCTWRPMDIGPGDPPAVLPNASSTATFSRDGKFVAWSIRGYPIVGVYSIESGETKMHIDTRRFDQKHASECDENHGVNIDARSLAFAPSGEYLAVTGWSSPLQVCNTSEKTDYVLLREGDMSTDIADITFLPDGRRLIAITEGGALLGWDGESKWDEAGFEEEGLHGNCLNAIACNENGLAVLGGTRETGVVMLCDTTANDPRWEAIGEHDRDGDNEYVKVGFFDNGRGVYSVGETDRVVKLWNGKTHQQIGEWKTGESSVFSAAVLSDNQLLTGDREGTISVWDLRKFIEELD